MKMINPVRIPFPERIIFPVEISFPERIPFPERIIFPVGRSCRSEYMKIEQYGIVLVNLEYSLGSEIRKTRPCVVISPDEMNRHLRTIVVAPMTTRSRNYPTRVRVRSRKRNGWIAVDQIRTVDRRRIIRELGELSEAEVRRLKRVIRECYVD